MMTRLREFFENLSLRKAIASALLIGLVVPIGITTWTTLTERREALLERLDQDHIRIVEVLVRGMQTPLWEIRPDAGEPLLKALMLDTRVTAITISSSLMPRFLGIEAPERRLGEIRSRLSSVIYKGEEIGRVRVDMDTGQLEAQLTEQWGQILATGLMQLVTGLLIIIALLRYKVLGPLQRLVNQSQALAAGDLDQALGWHRQDELGVLGRSFDRMCQSLRDLVVNLEQRNAALQDREAALANQTAVLRAILDNMTDGVNLVDAQLRLVAWNDRFIDLLGLPRELVQCDVHIQELTRFDLVRGGCDPVNQETTLQALRETFLTDRACTTRYRLANGRQIDIRRQPMADGGFVSTYTDVTEQVEAQRKADEALHLLEAVMDAVPAILHVKDRNLRYQMVNRQFLDWWKLNREEVLGRTNQEIFMGEKLTHEESNSRNGKPGKPPRFRNFISLIAQLNERDQQLVETGKPLPFYEAIYEEFGTEPVTLLATKVPLIGTDGRVTHIVTVGLDISERKKAEQERQRWLQLFQDAIESIPNGFAVYDASQRLVTCNTAFAALYHVSAETLVGLTATELFQQTLPLVRTLDGHPPPTEPTQAPHAAPKFNGAPVELHLKDGRWLLANWHPTAEGGVVYVRTDITHLKLMEQELRDSEQRFRSIAETHPVPVVISALEKQRLLYASPGLASLLGAPVADIVSSRPQRFFVNPADRGKIKAMLLARGNVEAYECSLRRMDGAEIPVAITARRLIYQGIDAAVGGIIDLTAIKRAEGEIARQREALHQSEKLSALGSLLAGVAHELNNPLSVVVGRTIMLEEATTDSRHQERLTKIRQAAERCVRIVKTFLAIARQQPPERTWVHLNELIAMALELVGYGLHTTDIEVNLDLASDLPPLFADADQLTQVFTNLILNAQQALSELTGPRRLAIATRYQPCAHQVRVEVTDNGPGIPAALRSRIFEPFYTSKPVGTGTGIGLSFSYGVVTSHGGQITLEDPPEGGARFVLTLPLADAETPAETGTPTREVSANHHAILIVDDELDIAEMLGEILAREGHQVEMVASGNEALQKLARQDYDVILSDLKMPDLDGPGLYRQLSQSHPHLLERLVFITGDTLGMGGSEFLARTGRPVVEKPFVPKEIVHMVGQILRNNQ